MCETPVRIKRDEPTEVYLIDKQTGEVTERRIDYLDVSCGKCNQCKAKKVKEWTFRIEQEIQSSSSALFVTLSYKDSYVPTTKLGYNTLNYKDISDYIKRLRRRSEKNDKYTQPIKYFAVGEYGPETYRPHWHLIIFNALAPQIIEAWSEHVQPTKSSPSIHISIGNVVVELAQTARARYMLNYLQKPQYDNIIEEYPDFDGKREMRHMSNKMGQSYLEKQGIKEHHKNIEHSYVRLENGEKLSLPRYYKDKLYKDYEKEQIWKRGYIKTLEKTEEKIKLTGVEQLKLDTKNSYAARKLKHIKKYSKPRIPKQ